MQYQFSVGSKRDAAFLALRRAVLRVTLRSRRAQGVRRRRAVVFVAGNIVDGLEVLENVEMRQSQRFASDDVLSNAQKSFGAKSAEVADVNEIGRTEMGNIEFNIR